MPNLEKLNLNYTEVTDKGIEQLNGLRKLQELALSGTAVTQNALLKLLPTSPVEFSIYLEYKD